MHATTEVTDKLVLETLLEKGQLREDNLMRARNLAETTSDSVLTLLLKLGNLSDRHLAEALSQLLDKKIIEDKDIPNDLDLTLTGVSEKFLVENQLLPIAMDEETIDVVMRDPRDRFLTQSIAIATGKSQQPHWITC